MNRRAVTSPNPEVPPVITMVFIIENGLVSAHRALGGWASRSERSGKAIGFGDPAEADFARSAGSIFERKAHCCGVRETTAGVDGGLG
jgi:hypothetical protein